jgi:hypothetical protein
MGAALRYAKVCTREKGDQPSRRVTAWIIARVAGLAPCALCRCDIFALNARKGAEAESLVRTRTAGLVRGCAQKRLHPP